MLNVLLLGFAGMMLSSVPVAPQAEPEKQGAPPAAPASGQRLTGTALSDAVIGHMFRTSGNSLSEYFHDNGTYALLSGEWGAVDTSKYIVREDRVCILRDKGDECRYIIKETGDNLHWVYNDGRLSRSLISLNIKSLEGKK